MVLDRPLVLEKIKFNMMNLSGKRLRPITLTYFFSLKKKSCILHTAKIVESQFRDLERKFVHTVRRRIPLVIYSSHIYFEQTNIIPNLLPEGVAGFTEYLKGRVALPLSGSIPEYERVLHHELARFLLCLTGLPYSSVMVYLIFDLLRFGFLKDWQSIGQVVNLPWEI